MSYNRSQTNSNFCCQQKEMTRFRGGLGSIGWLVDRCCRQLSFHFSERRRRHSDATIQDMLKLNQMIQSATSMECKMKLRSFPIHHLRFMGVHDAAHPNVEGWASQQAHVILAVHKRVTEYKKVPLSILSWSSKKIKTVLRSSLAAETSSMATCMAQLGWMRTLWSQMTTAGSFSDHHEGALKKQPAVLVTDCESLHDAVHKEGAAPSSPDKRLAIELATVNSPRYGRRSRRMVDRRQVRDSRLSRQARIEKD